MLNILLNHRSRDCDGVTRRDFMRIGGFGLSALGLPALLAARKAAAEDGYPVKDTAVVWLWLSGGATHVETFDPKMTAPSEYRSTTGECKTPIPGVSVGGTFPQIAKCADKMALVRSFAHKNSGHGGGTHWVMTGYDNRTSDNGGVPNRPSIGSIVSRFRGANNASTGMPTYVRMNTIGADGPAFLGSAYAPFSTSGDARKDMELTIDRNRINARRPLLDQLDKLRRDVDSSGLIEGLDGTGQQAFDVVLGNSAKAFDYKEESPDVIKRYGKGLGEQMLVARRLCEAGCGFVTINYGGWDMHGNIAKSITSRAPQMDQAVSAFIEDTCARGLDKRILLVISGEFGRTPRVNKNNGRDHWAPLSTLALAGGGLRMGQVVGDSAPHLDVPATTPIGPQNLMATIFHVMGIPPRIQYRDNFGRPVYMMDKGQPIAELV